MRARATVTFDVVPLNTLSVCVSLTSKWAHGVEGILVPCALGLSVPIVFLSPSVLTRAPGLFSQVHDVAECYQESGVKPLLRRFLFTLVSLVPLTTHRRASFFVSLRVHNGHSASLSEVFYVRNLLFPSGRVFSSTHFSLGVSSASHGRVHFRPGTFFGICFSCPAEDTLLRVHQSAVDSDLVSYTFSSLCSRLVEGSILLQCSGSSIDVEFALVSESWFHRNRHSGTAKSFVLGNFGSLLKYHVSSRLFRPTLFHCIRSFEGVFAEVGVHCCGSTLKRPSLRLSGPRELGSSLQACTVGSKFAFSFASYTCVHDFNNVRNVWFFCCVLPVLVGEIATYNCLTSFERTRLQRV